MRFRKLKKQVYNLLERDDFSLALDEICNFPPQQVVNPLFSFFYTQNELVKWRAVSAMGRVVSSLAEHHREAARIVMRRLLWNLNDESGGIGWGSPEAMGEIMAQHTGLAHEYHNMLMSYMIPHGNFLEHEILQRGLLWGVGRLAHASPELVRPSIAYLIPFMTSPDPFHRGLSSWTAALYDYGPTNRIMIAHLQDHAVFTLYQDGRLQEVTVSSMVK